MRNKQQPEESSSVGSGHLPQPFWVRWAARILARAVLRSAIHGYEVGWMDGKPMIATSISLAQIIRSVFAGDAVNCIDMENERRRLESDTLPEARRGR